MKALNRIIGFLFIITILAKPIAIAQEIENIPVGKYLVIGTFHIKENALRFSEYAKNKDDFKKAIVKYRQRSSVVILLQRGDQGYYITVRL